MAYCCATNVWHRPIVWSHKFTMAEMPLTLAFGVGESIFWMGASGNDILALRFCPNIEFTLCNESHKIIHCRVRSCNIVYLSIENHTSTSWVWRQVVCQEDHLNHAGLVFLCSLLSIFILTDLHPCKRDKMIFLC